MKQISPIPLLLTLLCLVNIPLQAEIRAMWVLPWSTNTPQKISTFITDAVLANQTDIMLEVRYRADALYQSNRRPDQFPNPEPPSYILNGNNFDPLDYALREGHKRNLRVHAWFVVFNSTPTDSLRIAQNHIYQKHRDWITYDRKSMQLQTPEQYGYFIDPGIPEVQDYLLNIIGDLVSGYPSLDGLHLDYVRYPDVNLGYHPVSLERFRASKGSTNMSFNQWRQLQVSGFVARTRALLDSIAPDLIFSAAVIADYGKAVELYAQNWQDWLSRDLVDYVYPMAYQQDKVEFDRQLKVINAMQKNERIIVGIRAWNANGNSLQPLENSSAYSINDVSGRIKAIRAKKFAGIALFSYDGLVKDKALEQLAEQEFSDKTIASMNAVEFFNHPQLRENYAADISVIPTNREYLLNILVPEEGKWHLEISDIEARILYSRDRYFLKGMNLDYWNGVMEEGDLIPSGDYLISLYRELDAYGYFIPIQFEVLAN